MSLRGRVKRGKNAESDASTPWEVHTDVSFQREEPGPIRLPALCRQAWLGPGQKESRSWIFSLQFLEFHPPPHKPSLYHQGFLVTIYFFSVAHWGSNLHHASSGNIFKNHFPRHFQYISSKLYLHLSSWLGHLTVTHPLSPEGPCRFTLVLS